MIFILFFPENRIWYFMQIVSIGGNLHEILNPVFWEKIREMIFLIFPRKQDLIFHANFRQFAWNIKSCFLRKIFQYIACWKFYPECKALNARLVKARTGLLRGEEKIGKLGSKGGLKILQKFEESIWQTPKLGSKLWTDCWYGTVEMVYGELWWN